MTFRLLIITVRRWGEDIFQRSTANDERVHQSDVNSEAWRGLLITQ